MERTNWTKDLIVSAIKHTMAALDINRMPTNEEMINVRHSTDLSNVISKRGGFYHWADTLKLPVKESETKTGTIYEQKALGLLVEKGFSIERMTTKHPYDLLVNNHIKVDVKVSTAYWLKDSSLVNTVGLSKEYATCDLYIIYLLHESGELDRMLVIPGHEVKHKYLNIGKNSKYNKYVDRWDYFDAYKKLYEEISI